MLWPSFSSFGGGSYDLKIKEVLSAPLIKLVDRERNGAHGFLIPNNDSFCRCRSISIGRLEGQAED